MGEGRPKHRALRGGIRNQKSRKQQTYHCGHRYGSMMSPDLLQSPSLILLGSLPRSRPFSSKAFSTATRASYLAQGQRGARGKARCKHAKIRICEHIKHSNVQNIRTFKHATENPSVLSVSYRMYPSKGAPLLLSVPSGLKMLMKGRLLRLPHS